MKKSAILRPVSQKAYAQFVDRIHHVASDPAKRKAMLTALDCYLEGDVSGYSRGLTADCAMAFEILRFDIDLAMTRSAKARMRRRKSAEVPVKRTTGDNISFERMCEIIQKFCGGRELTDDDDVTEEVAEPYMVPLTRRQRRAKARGAATKSRWRKLQ